MLVNLIIVLIGFALAIPVTFSNKETTRWISYLLGTLVCLVGVVLIFTLGMAV